MIDVRGFIEIVRKVLATHNLGAEGEYRRWLFQNKDGTRNLGLNEYGCADAANILYMIGELPGDTNKRTSWINVLQAFQKQDTGMFAEGTHDRIHTTAYCTAALDLFDVKPIYPVKELFPLKEKENLESFLEGLDWTNNPWGESLKGSGIFASLVLSGAVTSEWQDWYFDWLWRETDPETGLLRKGCIYENGELKGAPLFNHMAGTFHYFFNVEYARRALRYPEQMVDTCLKIFNEKLHPPVACSIGFAEADWIYTINHSSRQCGHRVKECQQAITSIALSLAEFLSTIDPDTHDQLNDLHRLIGTVCALAEMQAAVPGLIKTEVPLRPVLDRRPFV